MLEGAKLTGGNPKNSRVELDYYATDPNAVRRFLRCHQLHGDSFLEPSVGGGNIIRVLQERFPNAVVTGIDIVDRGWNETVVVDFLSWTPDRQYDYVITNPPFSLATEFIEKSIEIAQKQVIMFLKIQFLEGVKRKDFFDKHPPKYVYVCRKREAIFNNGYTYNPDTGKRWSNTITFAWYVWEKDYKGEPIIRWIDD